MRKTPILLSTMVLASSSVGLMLPLELSSERQRENAMVAFNNDPLSGSNLNVITKQKQMDEFLLKENDESSSFHLISVDYKQNQMGIQIFERENWQIKRVVVAYRDYEGGVTEAEADTNLSRLGAVDDETWKVIWDYDAKGARDLYRYVTPKEDGKVVFLRENLTDVLYYAVEYGQKADDGAGWQDEWWMRGKINYRNCVHSSVFDPEAMICVPEGDGTYGLRSANYDLIEMPVETVISWDEEWNKVQLQRYEAAQERLMDLKNDLYNMVKILDNIDETLAGLEVTLPKSENMSNLEALKSGNTQLQALSKELREYYSKLGESADQEELEKLRQEKLDLIGENELLIEEKGKIERENSELKSRIEVLERENDTSDKGLAESTVEAIPEELETTQELVATTEMRFVTVEREATVDNAVDENGDVVQDCDNKETEIAVPNLGNLENESKLTWWWVAIAGVGVIAVMTLGIQQWWRNKRK